MLSTSNEKEFMYTLLFSKTLFCMMVGREMKGTAITMYLLLNCENRKPEGVW